MSAMEGGSSHNPQPQEVLPPGNADHGTLGDKIVIALVGLPARGKTYIAKKLQRYLSFFHGAPTRVFHLETYRKKRFSERNESDFSFLSDETKEREVCVLDALNDIKDFIEAGKDKGLVAIFDATDGTRCRRRWLVDELSPILQSKSNIIFVESVCEDQTIVEQNIRATKLNLPTYHGMSEDSAIEDFRNRILNNTSHYQTMCEADKDFSWIKTVDGGKQVVLNKIFGYLPGRIASFVMNLHTTPKSIYLTRHGESNYNVKQKIGGDTELSPHGEEFATCLARWVQDNVVKHHPRARLWTSTLRRSIQTARHIRHDKVLINGESWITMRPRRWHDLDEIHAGKFDGMTYEEIAAQSPEEVAMRSRDKLGYRYPRGESYLDVFQRLETIIHELERLRDPVLIVAHQGILRILYGYFMWDEIKEREECPHIKIPLNEVKCLRPYAYGCTCESVTLLEFAAQHPSHPGVIANPDPPSH
uniref:6-phosphofructo-2-kinase domain-containing protein n=1 Tax=Guillardia theta TaxID=55529 RepID=A0A7S4M002_GUITH|mmetsp:Transcript_11886/g.40966  ORF Transcript_11886/g.40966 Transcript_11886/m.40966 type:complete len:475 (+) Transcript_11886:138-1562(+)